MLRQVTAFISLFYYLFIYIIFFLARRSKLRIDKRHAPVMLRKSKEISQTKNNRFNSCSGNSVSRPADLVVQGSILAGGENLLKSKLGNIAHSLLLPPTHRPDMIEILLKRT